MSLSTPTTVQAILGDNYGALEDGSLPGLQQFCDAAYLTMQRVAACAVKKGITLSDAEKEMIERWLAAHYYCQMDPLYTSRSTAGASGSFQRKQGDGFETTEYGATAVRLDPSGCLSSLGKRANARMFSISGGPGHTTSTLPTA